MKIPRDLSGSDLMKWERRTGQKVAPLNAAMQKLQAEIVGQGLTDLRQFRVGKYAKPPFQARD